MKTGILHFDKLPSPLDYIGLPNDIPIQEGQNQMDYDIIEDRLPDDLREKMRQYAIKIRGGAPHNDAMPVGVDESHVRIHGGKITWDDEPEV